jgi:hypothetical protein
MTVPAANGHVWRPTEQGQQHQFVYDDHAYDDEGRLKAKCGEKVAPVVEQRHCPDCLVQSPATEAADRMEQRAVDELPGISALPIGEVLRDR